MSVVPEQVSALEEFIPTRQTSVMLMRATVTVPAAEYNLLHLILPALLGHKVNDTHTHTHLPHLCVHEYYRVCVCVCFC